MVTYFRYFSQLPGSNLVPRPPPFSFAFGIIHGSGRAQRARPGNTYHVNDVGGREVDVGRAVPDYKHGHSESESEFLSG